jgi:hypothetical protein
VALVLSVGAFVFVGREARAEQFTQVQQQRTMAIQYTVVVNGEVTEPVVGAPSGEIPMGEMSPANTSPGGPAAPVGSAPSGNSSPPGDPASPGNLTPLVGTRPGASEPIPEPALRSDSVISVETGPAPPADSAPVPEPASQSEPSPPVDPVLASEEAPASGPIVPDSGEEESYPLWSSGTTASSMVETPESTVNVPGNLADGSPSRSAEDENLNSALLVNLFSGGETGLASVGGHEDPGSPSGGTGEPSNGTPQQPPSPITPPLTPPAGGSSFSLPGGQAGPGGVAPLLLCVLILGLVLLRRDGKLARAFCELPKPSSALLLPLERPG